MRRTLTLALAFLSLAVPAAAQDGGKLTWRGKAEDPKAAMADARRAGKPILLFFTSEGCPPCQKLSAGAFSDPKVVEASEALVCVFVDCDWGKKNEDLFRAYGVQGYPTVVFCDPQGEALGQLGSHEPADVVATIATVLRKVKDDAGPAFPPFALPLAHEARRSGRPLLLYFFDDSPASEAVTLALKDPVLKDVLRRVVPARAEFRRNTPDAATFEVDRAPTLLLLDAGAPKPEARPLARIAGSRSARELLRELEAALAGAAPPAPGPAATSAPPPPKARLGDEKVSDDDLDRQFIQAQIFVAREHLRKGEKAKAAEVLRDVLKAYPEQAAARDAQKLLQEIQGDAPPKR